ncbi:MAG: hypothetical protein WCS69_03315 [Ignavibacteriaceae bacterium]
MGDGRLLSRISVISSYSVNHFALLSQATRLRGIPVATIWQQIAH